MTADPQTAADWFAVRARLLAECAGWTALAEQAITGPSLPALLATDYGLRLNRAYLEMASAARAAADEAGRYADDAQLGATA